MPDRPSRFTWVVKLARFWAILTLALIGLAIAVTIARGITSLRQGVEVEPLLWWILALVGEAAAAVLVALLYGLVETVVANGAPSRPVWTAPSAWKASPRPCSNRPGAWWTSRRCPTRARAWFSAIARSKR